MLLSEDIPTPERPKTNPSLPNKKTKTVVRDMRGTCGYNILESCVSYKVVSLN